MNKNIRNVSLHISLIIFVGLLILLFIIGTILEIDTRKCSKERYKQNITICEKIGVTQSLNPFSLSNQCYCENTERIYFRK